MRFSQLGGDRVAAVIAGVTSVEARFDNVPAADLPEVRLVADVLPLAWYRAYESAAVYSTFDAPAVLTKAKVQAHTFAGCQASGALRRHSRRPARCAKFLLSPF
eukprot:6900891-Prymnesium_polylepis.1